jgi:voltage-gated potassium channel
MNLQRWQQAVQWPLAAAAVLFLVAYSVEVLGALDGPAATVPEIVIWSTWLLFLVDYVVSLSLAESRGRWFISHLFDLLVVILPMLRPLRLLRLVTLFSVLQRTSGAAFRGRIILYVAVASGLLVYVAALAMLDAERGGGGGIQSFGDALWWAFVTITTVGYGDLAPTTAVGRLIAVGIMIGGIALIGVVTATLASWIVEKVDSRADRDRVATAVEVAALHAELSALRSAMEQRSP